MRQLTLVPLVKKRRSTSQRATYCAPEPTRMFSTSRRHLTSRRIAMRARRMSCATVSYGHTAERKRWKPPGRVGGRSVKRRGAPVASVRNMSPTSL